MAARPVLVVTGGSRGIGAATAALAAADGYAVCIGFRRDGAAAARVVAHIEAAGGSAIAVRADVTVESDVVGLFDEAAARLGRVDALVNSAGIVAVQSRLADMSAERLRSVIDTNVVGTLLCTREAVRRLSTARGGNGGAVVNLSSLASVLGSAGEYVDYAASKGAVDTFTIGLAREVAAEGIRVNAVRPGIIATDIHASGGDPTRAARLGSSIPMGRAGLPEEVARAILWLLSDEATYTTGAVLDVGGGR